MEPSQQVLIASSLGMVASSIFFSMNTTLNYIAMPCYMFAREQLRQNHKLSAVTALILRQWKETYWRGHSVGPGLAVFQGLTYLYAAQQRGLSTTDGCLYLASAICAAGVIPYTLIFMLKTNEELLRRADVASKRSHMDVAGDEETKVDDVEVEVAYSLLHKWVGMSKTRAVMPLFAIGCVLYARTV